MPSGGFFLGRSAAVCLLKLLPSISYSCILYSACHQQLCALQKCLRKQQSPSREKAVFNSKGLTSWSKFDSYRNKSEHVSAITAGDSPHPLTFVTFPNNVSVLGSLIFRPWSMLVSDNWQNWNTCFFQRKFQFDMTSCAEVEHTALGLENEITEKYLLTEK